MCNSLFSSRNATQWSQPTSAKRAAIAHAAGNTASTQCDLWRLWRPLGIGFLEQRPCAPPAELGVDNAWLPVTHTSQRTFAAGGGTWLYYAAGCSDLLWNVGRTLLVKNRCHAVVALEARLNRTLHEAAMRVVRRLPAWSKALVSQARRA